MLAQAKQAAEKSGLNGAWVDTTTGAILLRKTQGDRPTVIRSTNDIINIVPKYQPDTFFFCAHKFFDVFDVSFAGNVGDGNMSC